MACLLLIAFTFLSSTSALANLSGESLFLPPGAAMRRSRYLNAPANTLQVRAPLGRHIALQCNFTNSDLEWTSDTTVTWYHERILIGRSDHATSIYDNTRLFVSNMSLLILSVTVSESGTYICDISESGPDNTSVHISSSAFELTAQDCSKELNPCKHGRCVLAASGPVFPRVRCQCMPHYYGEFCERDLPWRSSSIASYFALALASIILLVVLLYTLVRPTSRRPKIYHGYIKRGE